MDLGKIILYGVIALVVLWLGSIVLRVVFGLVFGLAAFLLPIALIGIVVYFAGRALGLIKG